MAKVIMRNEEGYKYPMVALVARDGDNMRRIKVYVNPGIFEFEIEDNTSYDEVEQMAWEELCSEINWYWKEVNEE